MFLLNKTVSPPSHPYSRYSSEASSVYTGYRLSDQRLVYATHCWFQVWWQNYTDSSNVIQIATTNYHKWIFPVDYGLFDPDNGFPELELLAHTCSLSMHTRSNSNDYYIQVNGSDVEISPDDTVLPLPYGPRGDTDTSPNNGLQAFYQLTYNPTVTHQYAIMLFIGAHATNFLAHATAAHWGKRINANIYLIGTFFWCEKEESSE